MKSFAFTTDIFRLNRTISLDFTDDLTQGKLNQNDNVRIQYDAESDTLTGVIVENGQQFGHVFDPTSYAADPYFVEEMEKMKDQD